MSSKAARNALRQMVDLDICQYIGDEEDGVYFGAAEENGKWFLTATVDCNSGHFTEEIVSWDGPYDTEEEALQGGRDAAIEWCINNQVRWK